MSFSLFLFTTMVASITALVGLLAVPAVGWQSLAGLRIQFVPEDLLD